MNVLVAPAALAELRRQQQLLALLNAPPSTPSAAISAATSAATSALELRLAAPAEHGLQAYRANAQATAERALLSAFPTLAAMLGASTFAAVARDHWHAHPPERGDLGEWGAALPGWIDAQPDLAEWPWLADCARLDWAIHRCERAADAEVDASSFQRLADTDPARLRLLWMPGTCWLASRWPIASIHAAHQPPAAAVADAAPDATQEDTDAGFDAVREAIAAQRGEAVLVARAGWRARVFTLDGAAQPGLAAWLHALDDGHDLASALAAAGDAFDFSAWLAQALQSGWLKGLAVAGDPSIQA